MRYKVCLFVLAVAVLIAAASNATTVRALDFRTIANNADIIAHGRVTTLTSQWAGDRNGIDTVVTLSVSRYLKGDVGAQIVFRVPGGKIGYLRSVRVGAPTFREGDEVVVFLASNGPQFPRIVGFNQGVLRVSVDPASGTRTVASPILAADVTTSTPLVRGDLSRKPESLEQFEARVQAVLQQPGSERPVAGRRNGAAIKRVR